MSALRAWTRIGDSGTESEHPVSASDCENILNDSVVLVSADGTICRFHEEANQLSAASIAAQATLLQQLGCDYLQGFLFFQPSSASEFGAYLDHVPGVDKGGENQ